MRLAYANKYFGLELAKTNYREREGNNAINTCKYK